MIEWADILVDAGIRMPPGKDEMSILCPFHEDSVNSCSINIDKGVWICFAGCGQGSLYSFIMKFFHISYEEAQQRVLQNESNFDINMFDEFGEEEQDLVEVSFPFQTGYVPDWIFDRDFDKKTLRKWECTTDNFCNLVIPVFTEVGMLVGWISRRQYETPKYLYSKGLKKSKLLFGQHHITDSVPFVCITEGSLDTMWLDQNGFPSIALLGASISQRQQELTLKIPTQELVLCLDNDEAGRIGLTKAMACLSNNFMVSYIKLPKEYKDVQDVRDRELLASIIKERTFL